MYTLHLVVDMRKDYPASSESSSIFNASNIRKPEFLWIRYLSVFTCKLFAQIQIVIIIAITVATK